MTTEDLIERLREYSGNNGFGHIDYADTMRNAADALEAQGREVARLREVNAEQYGALDLAARECTTLRAELAAIRAQEPVGHFLDTTYPGQVGQAYVYEHMRQGQEFYALTQSQAARVPDASPAAMDAGLVANMRYQEIREALENLMAWQVKNVKVWNHPTWDNVQAVIDRHAASPKIGGV